jgi:glucoamylase
MDGSARHWAWRTVGQLWGPTTIRLFGGFFLGKTVRMRTRLSVAAWVAAWVTALVIPVGLITVPAPAQAAAGTSWAPANKEGFGTSRTTQSPVWYTLGEGELTEVYYPDLGTPSVRDLRVVIDGGTAATTTRTTSADSKALVYRQVTAAAGWQLTKTYVTDPARATVMVDVDLRSLDGEPHAAAVRYDPALSNDGTDDQGRTDNGALIASDTRMASALVATPALTATATSATGDIVQTGRTVLDGVRHQRVTLSLGFAGNADAARRTADTSLARGFGAVAREYAAGWHTYVNRLREPASSLRTARERAVYLSSVMVLAAHEDKTFRGAFVASPTMPWAWGSSPTLENPSGAYHLVWSRDLYEIATGLLAAGDRAGAARALDYLFTRQQRPDGSFPQNSLVDGTPHWTGLQLDEVADPIVLAWQLGRRDATAWGHVQRAADFLIGWRDDQGHAAPYTPQERWENQAGYSPATIAAEIAGLVCAADLARANHDQTRARRYLRVADTWRANLTRWTATSTGPYSPRPYFLRLTKDGNPNAATAYDIGDSGPAGVDQRRIVDPSFLEVVRLGVLPARDPVVLNTLRVVDRQLAVRTPAGEFWHRYSFDGYGEQRDGGPVGRRLPCRQPGHHRQGVADLRRRAR